MLAAHLSADEQERVFNDRVQIFLTQLQFARRGKIEEAADDVVRALHCLGEIFQNKRDVAVVGEVLLPQVIDAHGDDGERVFDLVRHARGEPAD